MHAAVAATMAQVASRMNLIASLYVDDQGKPSIQAIPDSDIQIRDDYVMILVKVQITDLLRKTHSAKPSTLACVAAMFENPFTLP